MILLGDCLERLKELPDNSVDSVVTDPPYGLKFMGKKWDYDVPSVQMWREVLRVLKPGGHLLSFGGTRTYHRLASAIEDAGFEIRDQVVWLYGSGFPKSLDISKAIDKAAGAKREAVGKYSRPDGSKPRKALAGLPETQTYGTGLVADDRAITAPSTDAAKKWQGFGTALKPANEPICLARKPLEKGLTVAQNVLKWGVGGLNIDASRIEASAKDQDKMRVPVGKIDSGNVNMHRSGERTEIFEPNAQGRWPANLLLDEVAAEMLDAQSGVLKNGGQNSTSPDIEGALFGNRKSGNTKFAGDSGGASRFFYVAKASKRERNFGLEGMPEQRVRAYEGGEIASAKTPDSMGGRRTAQNHHPTVKPIKLMQYLITLITPPGGTVLDPFCGSGSTLVAAKSLGFESIGIEMAEEYFEIANKRVEAASAI